LSARRRVAVAGGGIAGLAAAYEIGRGARAAGLPVDGRLFEAGADLGGVIRTERVEGFLLDTGPDSLFKGKPAAAELAREIGLGGEILEASRQELPTLIYSRGRLRPLPAGLEMLAPSRIAPFLLSGLISPAGKLRMALEPLVPARRDGADESVAGFVRRRLGDEAARKVAGPLLAGIHAGDPERLSIWSTFPRLAELERDHGSLAAGMRALAAGDAGRARVRDPRAGPPAPPFVTFRSGIRAIVEGLARSIESVTLSTGSPVARLEIAGRGYRIVTGQGEAWEAAAVVLALPAPAAAALLRPIAPSAASELEAVRYVSTATVFLAFDAAAVAGTIPRATGFLIPASERRRIFGCTFVSNKFEGRAPAGRVLVRAFAGGALDEAAAALPDDRLIALVRGELKEILGLAAEPVLARVCRWEKANPQYEVGHGRKVEAVDTILAAHPGLFVTGSGLRGVGIPDGVALGRAAGRAVLEYLGAG
jgi:oxygen-dependent protoporphyrinogen oxidase